MGILAPINTISVNNSTLRIKKHHSCISSPPSEGTVKQRKQPKATGTHHAMAQYPKIHSEYNMLEDKGCLHLSKANLSRLTFIDLGINTVNKLATISEIRGVGL